MNFFDVAGFILGVVAVVLSIVAIVASFYAARRSASLPIELAILSEFRSAEARSARAIVINLRQRSDVEDGGFEAQPQEIRAAVRSVAHFYDHVGVLISGGFVRKRPFVQFMGLSAHECWEASKRIIEAERRLRGDDAFIKFFEQFGTTRIDRVSQASYDRWLREGMTRIELA